MSSILIGGTQPPAACLRAGGFPFSAIPSGALCHPANWERRMGGCQGRNSMGTRLALRFDTRRFTLWHTAAARRNARFLRFASAFLRNGPPAEPPFPYICLRNGPTAPRFRRFCTRTVRHPKPSAAAPPLRTLPPSRRSARNDRKTPHLPVLKYSPTFVVTY